MAMLAPVTPANFDFFTLVKEAALTQEEKTDRLQRMLRVVFLHFLNTELPRILNEKDLVTLEKMTEHMEAIDMIEVQTFLRSKIPDYDKIITVKMLDLKKKLVIKHYESERKLLELDQKRTGTDHLTEILAIDRLLLAAQNNNWVEVREIVPHTNPIVPPLTTLSH